MSTVKDKPILIHTKQSEYDLAVKRHEDYLSKLDALCFLLAPYGEVKKVDYKQISEAPRNFVEAHILKHFATNSNFNPSYQKLKEMMELKDEEIEKVLHAISMMGNSSALITKPKIEKYQLWAKSEKQHKRLKAINAIEKQIGVLYQLDKTKLNSYFARTWANGSSGVFINKRGKLELNPYYVLNGGARQGI